MASGRTLGRYTLLTRLGETSLGTLHKAADPQGHGVAVHELAPGRPITPRLFLETVRAAGRLNHPGLARVIDFGLADEAMYWVLAETPGQSLRERAEELRLAGGGLPALEAAALIMALGRALEYARREGQPAPRLTLQDVGLRTGASGTAIPLLLTAGLAPLTAADERATPAEEAHTLARWLALLITGRPIETAPDVEVAALPDVLRPILHRALASGAGRFADAGAFVAALQTVELPSLPPAAEPVRREPPAETVALTTRTPAEVPAAVGLRINEPGGRVWEAVLSEAGLTLGRGPENNVVLDDAQVSRFHARLDLRDDACWVTDLGSLNGTYLGEWRLPPETPTIWRPATPLRVGARTLQLVSAARLDATTRAPAGGQPLPAAVLRSGEAGDGPVGLLLEAGKVTAAPGATATVGLTLFNEGPHDDHFILSLSGPPPSWLSLPGPAYVRPGVPHGLRLAFQPPRAPTARAGRYPVTIRVASQAQPDQVVETTLTLVVTAYAQFNSTLQPAELAAGEPAVLRIVNEGNAPATFKVDLQADEALSFDPPAEEVLVAEGQTAAVEFSSDLRRARWLGGARRHPFHARVQAEDGRTQTHAGVLVSTGLLPGWLLGLAGLVLVVLAGVAALNLWPDALPDDRAPATAAAATQRAVAQAQATLQRRAAATGTALWLAADDDRDGLPNQSELAANTLLDKFDTDEDGLSDGEEAKLGTLPLNPDSDGDGLPDGEEVRRGLNPLQADSDADGTPDPADAVFGAPATATPAPSATPPATPSPAIITLSGLSPASATAGAGALVLNVNGSNLASGLVVRWNGADRATQFVSSSLLTALIPAGDLAAAAIASVTLYSPAANAVVAGPLTFTVNNPAPVLNAGGLSPASATAGGQAFTLVVNGANFVSGAVVRWNGVDRITAVNSRAQVVAFINASDLVEAGQAAVTVFNPGPGGGVSNAQTFTVGNPVPVLASLAPATALAGSPTLTVTVTGAGFARGALVRWNGAERPTTFVNAGRLEVVLAAADLAAAGTGSLTVVNPAPGGGPSNSLALPIVYPAPALTAVSPLTATAGAPAFTLVITGTGFVNGVSTVVWNGAARVTYFVTSTQLTITVPAGDVAAAGTAQVAVSNPAPGGGLSQPATPFTIVP